MLCIVTICALVLSVLNWLIFAMVVFWEKRPAAPVASLKRSEAQGSDLDPTKIIKEAGGLASAFSKAGAAPTAATMSLVCLLIAAVAAGINKVG